MAIKIEYFYVFINHCVSLSEKYSAYLIITDWVISSVGICVCCLYVLGITPLSEIVLLTKSEIFLLWSVSSLHCFCYCTQGFSFMYFFFQHYWYLELKESCSENHFIYILKFVLYILRYKLKSYSNKKRKIPKSIQPDQRRHLEPQTNMTRNDSSHTIV